MALLTHSGGLAARVAGSAPQSSARHERRAWVVGALSFAVMALELVAGRWLNSMALISDGLHTSTHVGVMAVASGAYLYERRRRLDPRFAFGPGKAPDLAAFASGVGLAVVAFFIGLESLQRLIQPEPVLLKDAAVVAAVSLAVGVVSAVLLHQGPDPDEAAGRLDTRDLNLWAAYLHMLADVVTSVLALGALVVGAALGWVQLDAVVGLVNAGVVALFAARLIRRASHTLLDLAPAAALEEARDRLSATDRGALVRVWTVARGRLVVSVSPEGGRSLDASSLDRLQRMPGVAHVLVEAASSSDRAAPRLHPH